MIQRNNFKPFPYVFTSGGKTAGGIGLSGPGGILWPIYPGSSDGMLKVKSSGVPAPILLPSITFNTDFIKVGDVIGVDFTFVPNTQRLLTASSVSGFVSPYAQVVYSYEGAVLYPEDTEFEDIEDDLDQDIEPIAYYAFAYDGSGVNNEVASELLDETAPLDILISLSGALTPNTSEDERVVTVSFSKLVLALKFINGGDIFAGVDMEWFISYTIDSQSFTISVETIDFPSTLGIPAKSLNIRVDNIDCVDHPEQVGYASFYLGGINPGMSQSAVTNVLSTDEFTGVLGPCWLPHTTFYPLVELNKTMPNETPVTLLEVPEGDMAYVGELQGTGIFQRSMSNLPPEYLVSNIGELLSYPKKESRRGYGSFQPDYIDTRIIHDTCIYPITGPDDIEQIKEFRYMHKRATRPLYLAV